MHPHSAKVVPPSVDSAPDGSCLWPKHREEQWAAQSSPITRITSWIVLGIQALIIFSSFFTDSLNINILSIIAGFAILKGSQAWLRFQTFSSTFMACSIGWLLAPGIIWNEPIEIDFYSRAKSFSRNDLEFWTLGVSLAGVFTMEAAVCILCLRTRSLAFWTKKARVWGGIAIGLAILGILLNGWDSYQARKAHQATTEELKIEIAAIKRHLDSARSPHPFDPEKILRANPRIKQVYWNNFAPAYGFSASNTIYDRDNSNTWTLQGGFEIEHTTPSGTKGDIILFLDPPPEE